jgi:tRNA nucleotidyltransferase/poly(A) polymerase
LSRLYFLPSHPIGYQPIYTRGEGGGAVRDFLNYQFHQNDGRGYQPKDLDLTTNLSEEEILERLRTPEAAQAGIKVKEKESVDTFGVVFSHVNGEDFEIAPFRKDIGIADGRRPEKTERGSIYDDAMRRDLTMNNLYYDFDKGKILDFNQNGQGIEDIKNGVARPVGNPFQRFNEDKLRVLRLIRFFSRFNDGDITQKLDPHTREAIEKYKNLQSFGITPERIYMEFSAAVKQSKNTTALLYNYLNLDLINTIFPGLRVNTNGINRLGNTKNIKVILAWILRDNKNAADLLLKLKYPSEITSRVGFLLRLYQQLNVAPEMQMNKIHPLTKERDRYIDPKFDFAKRQQMTTDVQNDINEFSRIIGMDLNPARFQHFATYQPPEINSQELIAKGLKGPQIGQEQDKIRDQHYNQSFQNWLKNKS